MAKPQLENGYTKIANEILEQLVQVPLAPNQWRVLLIIIRKTYGFNKKVDYIANSQICEATGLGKSVVSRALHILNDMNVIKRKGKFIGFQKDWEQWGKLAESSTIDVKLAVQATSEKLAIQSTELAESSTELAIQATKVSSPVVAQKKKETIQKKLYKRKYGDFTNILLTDEEHQKLIAKFGEQDAQERIERLSLALASKGYKYKSHYATILSWYLRDLKQGGQNAITGRSTEKAYDPRFRGQPPEHYAEQREELARERQAAKKAAEDTRAD